MSKSAIEIQISARVRAPRNGRPITKAIVEEAVRRKADDPDLEIPGIELRIVRWRHGGGQWIERKGDDSHEWNRFRVFLPSASFVIGSIEKVRSR